MTQITKVLALCALLSMRPAFSLVEAKPEKKKEVKKALQQEIKKDPRKHFWLDIGAGLPQLASVQIAYRFFPHWQWGAGIGMLPGGKGLYSKTFDLPSENVTLKNKEFVTFDSPKMDSSLGTISPFVRYFPAETNFYFQFTLAILQNKNTFRSALKDVYGNTVTDGAYRGTINLLQFLPTVAIGHAFSSQLFFFNVNMGVTFIATAQATISSEGEIPDRLGGTAANQEVFDKLNAKTKKAIDEAVSAMREEVPVFPSIQLAFGFMF